MVGQSVKAAKPFYEQIEEVRRHALTDIGSAA
jgi:hypothetical protein